MLPLFPPDQDGIRKPVGRPRTGISRDQVLALRTEGLSYRAVARRLLISPALAHWLAHDAPAVGPGGRSETLRTHFEMDPDPAVSLQPSHRPGALGARDRKNP